MPTAQSDQSDSGLHAEELALRFEELRPALLGIATGILGSRDEAKDIVQDAWLRLERNGTSGIRDLRAWLMTIVQRLCLDRLRKHNVRGDEAVNVVDVSGDGFYAGNPEIELSMVQDVGLALAVVFKHLTPSQRICLVLSDAFSVPFEYIGRLLRTSAEAARKQSSRARKVLREVAPIQDAGLLPSPELLTAFLAAARRGDFRALISALDPEGEVSRGWDDRLLLLREVEEPYSSKVDLEHVPSLLSVWTEGIRRPRPVPAKLEVDKLPSIFSGWIAAIMLLAGRDVPGITSVVVPREDGSTGEQE